MQNKITVIITIRNRDTLRIEKQIASIRSAGADPAFYIVDYGSQESYAKQYCTLCTKFNLQYTHIYAEGLPWNKCRALNYGAKTAKTPFIVTTDADMLYESNPFKYCLDNYEDKTMYHMETYWLPKNGDKKKAKYAGHGNSGGFQFIAKSAFEEIGGYDERMLYWGVEDLDFPDRLKKIGYTQVWLPDTFRLYHQWHPVSEANCRRPQTATVNTLKYAWENQLTPVIKQDWGKTLTEKDRPILQELHNRKPKIIELQNSELSSWETADFILNTQKERFIKLVLGRRINNGLFMRIKNAAKIVLKPVSAFTAMSSTINMNFDILYELIPLLQNHGLRDYYIESDLSSVFLLWG